MLQNQGSAALGLTAAERSDSVELSEEGFFFTGLARDGVTADGVIDDVTVACELALLL